ncbi:hypothetical protein KUTeg_011096 [Tegillarca granosa]|uniref:RING-type domain-containing protein n=1 Tax=Tegillarca granosa TaxID=220873 RepID=A0ABQ9F6B1_TEGGR|nr:hypothetical protein KUTeg_011096 [Tegillarca granosa]
MDLKNKLVMISSGEKKESGTLECYRKGCDSDLDNKFQVTNPLTVHSSKLIDKLKCKNNEILKKSTSLSSDSGNTDTSSVCDWADGSSDAYKHSYHSNTYPGNGGPDSHIHSMNGKQVGSSPKRFRKRTPSRAKSVENDEIPNSRKVINGHILIFSDSSDSQSEPSTSNNGLANYKRRRIGSQMSEESTESETLSCDIVDKFDVMDLKSSNESSREAMRTAENDHKHVLANLKYAIPYLSDKLKASLANRLTKEDNSSNLDTIGNNVKSEDTDKTLVTSKTDRTSSCDNNDSDFICNGSPSSEKDLLLSNSQGFDERSNQDDLVFDSRPSLSTVLAGFDDTWEDGGIGFYGNHTDSSDDEIVNHLDSDHESTESDGPDVLPLFNLNESSDSGEADDEFECECDHCQLIRLQRGSENRRGVTNLPTTSDHNEDASHRHEMWSAWLPDMDDEEGLYRINIEELSPLDILMNDRRNELELMFENVILQMLAVHPDLLSDHAPPPASSSIIENLPCFAVTKEHLEQGLSCPICLCPCELEETVSQLPCQHLFHPLCVQAWLKKSGTCPVCRHAL